MWIRGTLIKKRKETEMKKTLITIALVVLMTGCGVWVEIATAPDGTVTVLYENRRPFAPENASVTTPSGWVITMGEQPTQNAAMGKLTDAVVVLSGAATP